MCDSSASTSNNNLTERRPKRIKKKRRVQYKMRTRKRKRNKQASEAVLCLGFLFLTCNKSKCCKVSKSKWAYVSTFKRHVKWKYERKKEKRRLNGQSILTLMKVMGTFTLLMHMCCTSDEVLTLKLDRKRKQKRKKIKRQKNNLTVMLIVKLRTLKQKSLKQGWTLTVETVKQFETMEERAASKMRKVNRPEDFLQVINCLLKVFLTYGSTIVGYKRPLGINVSKPQRCKLLCESNKEECTCSDVLKQLHIPMGESSTYKVILELTQKIVIFSVCAEKLQNYVCEKLQQFCNEELISKLLSSLLSWIILCLSSSSSSLCDWSPNVNTTNPSSTNTIDIIDFNENGAYAPSRCDQKDIVLINTKPQDKCRAEEDKSNIDTVFGEALSFSPDPDSSSEEERRIGLDSSIGNTTCSIGKKDVREMTVFCKENYKELENAREIINNENSNLIQPFGYSMKSSIQHYDSMKTEAKKEMTSKISQPLHTNEFKSVNTKEEKNKHNLMPTWIQDICNPFGKGFKWSGLFSGQTFYQTIIAYPLYPHHGNINNLMHYEVLRLCTFNFSMFPASYDVWVTQLAQSGFYYSSNDQLIRCFGCGCVVQGQPMNSSLNAIHHQQCLRHELNRPLQEWTQGLSQEDFSQYFIWYGHLRPYLFDAENFSIDREFSSSAPDVSQSQDDSHLARRDSGFVTETSYFTSQEGIELPDMGMMPERADSNNMSAGVAVQESAEILGRPEVLTSSAAAPIPLEHSWVQDNANESGNAGAVGGSMGGVPFDLRQASYPQYASTQARLLTFSNWSPEHSHRPEDLANAGFFYAGYADCARCFYCGLGLKYWRPDDIPAYQHARFRPHCVFNLMYKGQEYIDRVQEDFRSEQQQTGQGIASENTPAAPSVPVTPASQNVQPSVLEPQSEPSSTIETEFAEPYMSLPAVIEALNSGWSRTQVSQAVTHIINEFGLENLVADMLQDVLTNFNMDDLNEHAPYLGSEDSQLSENQTSGHEEDANQLIGSVRSGLIAAGETVADVAQPQESDQAQAPLVQQVAPSQLDPEEEYRLVEREHTFLKERMTCSECHQRPVSCVYLPCGHVIACNPCAEKAILCKLCNKRIIGTANIYLA